jgi:hypothetical protein
VIVIARTATRAEPAINKDNVETPGADFVMKGSQFVDAVLPLAGAGW